MCRMEQGRSFVKRCDPDGDAGGKASWVLDGRAKSATPQREHLVEASV